MYLDRSGIGSCNIKRRQQQCRVKETPSVRWFNKELQPIYSYAATSMVTPATSRKRPASSPLTAEALQPTTSVGTSLRLALRARLIPHPSWRALRDYHIQILPRPLLPRLFDHFQYAKCFETLLVFPNSKLWHTEAREYATALERYANTARGMGKLCRAMPQTRGIPYGDVQFFTRSSDFF